VQQVIHQRRETSWAAATKTGGKGFNPFYACATKIQVKIKVETNSQNSLNHYKC